MQVEWKILRQRVHDYDFLLLIQEAEITHIRIAVLVIEVVVKRCLPFVDRIQMRELSFELFLTHSEWCMLASFLCAVLGR